MQPRVRAMVVGFMVAGLLSVVPVAVSAATVSGVTDTEIAKHHISVSQWSLLTAYLGYHSVADGHLAMVTRNIRTFWDEVGGANPGAQSLSRKVEELDLLVATARLADATVSVVNGKGRTVNWKTYMKKPHSDYYFSVYDRSTGKLLSTITVPWAEPNRAVTATVSKSSKSSVASKKKGSLHVKKGSLHVKKGSLHMKKGSLHVKKGSLHVKKGSLHVKKGRLHVKKRSPHVKKRRPHHKSSIKQ